MHYQRNWSFFLGPSSNHSGGVTALFGDGAVRFINDNIDSWNGDAIFMNEMSYYGNLLPLGVWQQLATRAGGEVNLDY